MYVIEKDITAIGRDLACDVPLPEDGSVSKRHAEIKKQHDAYFIIDLKSTNGTFVNGKKISTSQLKNDDVITVGNTQITFKHETWQTLKMIK